MNSIRKLALCTILSALIYIVSARSVCPGCLSDEKELFPELKTQVENLQYEIEMMTKEKYVDPLIPLTYRSQKSERYTLVFVKVKAIGLSDKISYLHLRIKQHPRSRPWLENVLKKDSENEPLEWFDKKDDDCVGCYQREMVQEADEKVKELVESVREEIEAKAGKDYVSIKPLSYYRQLVAGYKYYIKAVVKDCSNRESYVHLHIFEPLPHTNEPPELIALLEDVTIDTPLDYNPQRHRL